MKTVGIERDNNVIKGIFALKREKILKENRVK